MAENKSSSPKAVPNKHTDASGDCVTVLEELELHAAGEKKKKESKDTECSQDNASSFQNTYMYRSEYYMGQYKPSISLTTLPPELVLLVFSYLDARFTLRVVCCVCKLFCYLLQSESSWKSRFSKRWPARDNKEDYPFVSRLVQTIL